MVIVITIHLCDRLTVSALMLLCGSSHVSRIVRYFTLPRQRADAQRPSLRQPCGRSWRHVSTWRLSPIVWQSITIVTLLCRFASQQGLFISPVCVLRQHLKGFEDQHKLRKQQNYAMLMLKVNWKIRCRKHILCAQLLCDWLIRNFFSFSLRESFACATEYQSRVSFIVRFRSFVTTCSVGLWLQIDSDSPLSLLAD